MSGARESKCTLYPAGSPGQVIGTPSSGLMKLSSRRFGAGIVSSPVQSNMFTFSELVVLEPKNVCRSGERMKIYTGTKYRAHVTTVENFGRDILADRSE